MVKRLVSLGRGRSTKARFQSWRYCHLWPVNWLAALQTPFQHNRDEATGWDYIAYTGILCVLPCFRLFLSCSRAGSKGSKPSLRGWQTMLARMQMRLAIRLK